MTIADQLIEEGKIEGIVEVAITDQRGNGTQSSGRMNQSSPRRDSEVKTESPNQLIRGIQMLPIP